MNQEKRRKRAKDKAKKNRLYREKTRVDENGKRVRKERETSWPMPVVPPV